MRTSLPVSLFLWGTQSVRHDPIRRSDCDLQTLHGSEAVWQSCGVVSVPNATRNLDGVSPTASLLVPIRWAFLIRFASTAKAFFVT